MPTIAYFLGVAVRMFFNDHDPPHFHVRYQGYRARILIADGEIIDGHLPPTVTRLVKEWTTLRRAYAKLDCRTIRRAARTDWRA